MHIAKILLVHITIIILFASAATSYPSTTEDMPPHWNSDWDYCQEIKIPIKTNQSEAIYQPIDMKIIFENPCWTINENQTSIRILCWDESQWHELESQIYDLKESKINYVQSCSIVFLIPSFANGKERYFIYYDDSEKTPPNYKNHVDVEDLYYKITPMSDVTAEAKYYGIKEDGICICGVGQEGTLLDRSFSNILITQKEKKEEFDLLNMDQIVSLAFSYYYGNDEEDESASDQKFVYKDIFIDGNLMVEFGIISESNLKDIRTAVVYKYYYTPQEDKRISVKVKHNITKNILVYGKENIDGRFGAFVSFKSRNPVIKRMNFGDIYPYLHFYSEEDKIDTYQMNVDPESKNREWIITYQDDADIGSESWIAYGEDTTGKVDSLIFSSNENIVKSGTDERDGIQLKVAEKEQFNFLNTEIDYASINFGRNSYEAGSSHDLKIPDDLVVEFDAEIFTSEKGGYIAVQKEAKIYKELLAHRDSSGDSTFDEEGKKHDLTVITHFGGTRFSYPYLASVTSRRFPVMWVELYDNENIVDSGVANKSLFFRGRADVTFKDVSEGDYLIKVFWKMDNQTKFFRGAKIISLEENKKVHVFCSWERSLELVFSDQNGVAIGGIYTILLNDDGWIFDENISLSDGSAILKAPYNSKDSYQLKAYYRDFLIYDGVIKNSLRDIVVDFGIELFDLTVEVKDSLDLPPGISIHPILSTSKSDDKLEILGEYINSGRFFFEDIPSGSYILQISYAGFVDEKEINIPQVGDFISLNFSANFEVDVEILDSRGNPLSYDHVYFDIERNGDVVCEFGDTCFFLPPGSYTFNAFVDGQFVGSKDVDLTNSRQIHLVTSVVSMTPVYIVFLAFVLFVIFVSLALMKKIEFTSFLKLLAVILIIVSIFQPWWYLSGSTADSTAMQDTQMFIDPQVMIEKTNFEGKTSYDVAEMPDVFIDMLGIVVTISYIACFMFIISFLSKRFYKKRYSLVFCILGVLIILGIISTMYIGTAKLCELSIGDVYGEGFIDVNIGSNTVSMNSNWGFSYGFYFVILSFIITVIAFILELKKTLKVVKIF